MKSQMIRIRSLVIRALDGVYGSPNTVSSGRGNVY